MIKQNAPRTYYTEWNKLEKQMLYINTQTHIYIYMKSEKMLLMNLFAGQQWITINCGKFWRRWEYQTTCLLRNLYADQEATIRTGHGTTDWFQIGKGVRQSCILSPCLYNLYVEYIMWNAGLDEAQAGIKIAGKISIISDMYMTLPLWQKAKKN